MPFRHFSPEHLASRFSSPEAKELIPPTESVDVLVEQTVEELKTKYPKRYELYTQWLREKDHMSEEDQNSMRRWLKTMNALDEYSFFSHEDKDTTLRTQQKDVFDAMRDHIEAGHRMGYVRLPTGVGKTVLFVELAEAVNGTTLVVTSRRSLVGQTVDKFKEFAEGLDVGVRYTAHKDIGKQVTVTTYDSLMLGLKSGEIDPKTFDLVILDEAHRGLSQQRKEAVGRFDQSFVLGFSATPTFSDTKSLDHLLGESIYEMKVKEAIEGGLLSGVSVVVAKTDVDLSRVSLDTLGQYQPNELEAAVNTAMLTKAGIDLYKELFTGEQAVVFCVGVNHAKSVAEAFQDNGIVSAAVWGSMPDVDRDRILDAYKRGEIQVLTNVDVLTEGFDAPSMSVCMNLAPTQSLVRAEQRAGRALRTDPVRKDKMATVVEFLHRETRARLSPVLFSEVLQSAAVIPHTSDPKTSVAARTKTTERSVISILGLEVITNAEEIMRITQEGIASREVERKQFLSWTDFVVAVRQVVKDAGVDGTQRWYARAQRDHANWPSNPHVFYPEWSSWAELFGKEGVEIIERIPWGDFVVSVRQAAKDARVAGSRDWYQKTKKNHANWPFEPNVFYPEWSSWPELFGREKVETVPKLSWTDFVDSVRKAAQDVEVVATVKWYQKTKKEHANWPFDPNVFYPEWSSWPELFGR